METNKKFILKTTAIVIVVVFIFGLLIYLGNKKIKQEEGISQQEKIEIGVIKVKNIYPTNGIVEMANTKNSISVFLDARVDLETLQISSSPEIGFKPSVLVDHPTRLILTPKTQWKEDQIYKITIHRGLKNFDGSAELKEDVVMEFSVKPIERSQNTNPL